LKKDNIIKDLDILRKEKQKNYLLIGILFIISFAVAVLYFYINKKKANAVLQEQRNKLKYINGKLNEALALKDTFLSILSHDLRSPVLALGSSLKKLKTAEIKQGSDAFQVHMDMFEKQYETTKNLLENLLLWANAQSDKLPYKREKLFIEEIIANCISVYAEAAQQKNVEITTSVSDNLEVSADKFMLESIFRNLISNALKFSYEGGQINISAQEKAENILITVSDTGTGMGEDALEKLFSVGQNFSKSGTSGEKGTGLGLLLCKEFVEKNGGTIWAESSKGKGSRFCFTLLK
jgi:signal transduction histidine kinase